MTWPQSHCGWTSQPRSEPAYLISEPLLLPYTVSWSLVYASVLDVMMTCGQRCFLFHGRFSLGFTTLELLRQAGLG